MSIPDDVVGNIVSESGKIIRSTYMNEFGYALYQEPAEKIHHEMSLRFLIDRIFHCIKHYKDYSVLENAIFDHDDGIIQVNDIINSVKSHYEIIKTIGSRKYRILKKLYTSGGINDQGTLVLFKSIYTFENYDLTPIKEYQENYDVEILYQLSGLLFKTEPDYIPFMIKMAGYYDMIVYKNQFIIDTFETPYQILHGAMI